MANLTNAQLRSKLPAGITLDANTYPDGDSCLPVVVKFLTACEEAQTEQNATAPSGEDVQFVTKGVGAETTIERNGATHRVQLVNRSVVAYEKLAVTDVLPVLV